MQKLGRCATVSVEVRLPRRGVCLVPPPPAAESFDEEERDLVFRPLPDETGVFETRQPPRESEIRTSATKASAAVDVVTAHLYCDWRYEAG
jgi:hypothetical protein